MRLVMRVLLIESVLSWAMVLAGWTRIAVLIRPFALQSLQAVAWDRAWRVGLSLLVGLPIVAGWPVLLKPALSGYTHGDWVNLAIPWWLLVGITGLFLLGAEIRAARLR
jgi:hypothetical protein